MDKLNLIKLFLTICQTGTFTSAASQLSLDPSTVSKAISQLEKSLGFLLFIRSTRKLQLTDNGEIYRDQCKHLLNELESCEQALSEKQVEPKGILKINLPVAYGQLYTIPMIGRFHERYPDITLDISLTDNYVDLISNSIDIAIRSGKLQDSRLVAKKLSPMDFATCASPNLLKKLEPITSDNIATLPWILYRFSQTGRIMPVVHVEQVDKRQIHTKISPEPMLVITDGFSMVTACKAGIGLIQAPHFLVRDALAKGELKTVQPNYRHSEFNVYAYYLNKDYVSAKVRVFLNFITEELESFGESHDSTPLIP